MAQMDKPRLSFWQIFNISFGFFGIQIAFALQNANVSRIFQTLGASIEALPVLWLAGPITGLLVQPIVGHFSDRTWGPLGRRRPYFLIGAILSTLALFVMPNSPYLWVAAVTLWILDASINISMEPFRAFVGDMLPSEQRTRGFAMQTIFIGTGAFLASLAPWTLTELFGVSAEAPAGVIPDAVKYSFYIGAVALFLAVGWTVVSSKEYSSSPSRKKDDRTDPTSELSYMPHDASGISPADVLSPGWLGVQFSMNVTYMLGTFSALYAQRQHGSPNSSPFVNPSPSESCSQRSVVHVYPWSMNCTPKAFIAPPPAHVVCPRP